MTIAYFIRHGETEWNAQGRLQGHTDIPLNATGIAQAHDLKERLSPVAFAAAFSSDLSRARQTAQLVIEPHQLSVVESSALRERHAGALEGIPVTELDQHIRPFFLSPQSQTKETYLTTPWHPELEPSASVYQRVTQFLFSCIQHYAHQTILVATHGGVLRSLLDHIAFQPKQRWIVANCGFIKLEIKSTQLQLLDCQGVTQRSVL